MKKILFLILPAIGLLTVGCSKMKIEDFEGKQPKFVLEQYFSGKTRAWGIVKDRFGNIRRQFTVDMTGTWDGQVLTLDESFNYDDGETDNRVWKIRKIGAHDYEGEAEDVVGKAVGKAYGSALNWSYILALKISGRTWNVTFDDWMFLQPNGVLFNSAEMSKFGITIGEITLFFKKPGEKSQASVEDIFAVAAE